MRIYAYGLALAGLIMSTSGMCANVTGMQTTRLVVVRDHELHYPNLDVGFVATRTMGTNEIVFTATCEPGVSTGTVRKSGFKPRAQLAMSRGTAVLAAGNGAIVRGPTSLVGNYWGIQAVPNTQVSVEEGPYKISLSDVSGHSAATCNTDVQLWLGWDTDKPRGIGVFDGSDYVDKDYAGAYYIAVGNAKLDTVQRFIEIQYPREITLTPGEKNGLLNIDDSGMGGQIAKITVSVNISEPIKNSVSVRDNNGKVLTDGETVDIQSNSKYSLDITTDGSPAVGVTAGTIRMGVTMT